MMTNENYKNWNGCKCGEWVKHGSGWLCLTCKMPFEDQMELVHDHYEKQLDAVRKFPIKVIVKEDGVWLHFEAGEGRSALVNLNQIVLNMETGGITRGICLDALRATLNGEGK